MVCKNTLGMSNRPAITSYAKHGIKMNALDKFRKANQEIIFDVLEKKEIRLLFASFNRQNSSFYIDNNQKQFEFGQMIVEGSKIMKEENWKEDCTLEEIIRDLCYTILKNINSNFDKIEYFGNFVFHPKNRKINLEYKIDIFEYEFCQEYCF